MHKAAATAAHDHRTALQVKKTRQQRQEANQGTEGEEACTGVKDLNPSEKDMGKR